MASIAEQKAALVCWLRFEDESDPCKDEIGTTTWTAAGDYAVEYDDTIGAHAFRFNSNGYTEMTNTVTLGGDRDYTIDLWGVISSAEAYNYLQSTSNNAGTWEADDKAKYFYGGLGSVSTYNKANDLQTLNEWHHFAMVYLHESQTLMCFVDGHLVASGTQAVDYTWKFGLGVCIWTAHNYHSLHNDNGSAAEFRIFDGLAVWTEDFTPPTVSEYEQFYIEDLDDQKLYSGAELKSALKCWLRFDDLEAPLKDETGNTAWTMNGQPEYTARLAGNYTGLYFDSSDYLLMTGDIELGGADYTVDYWVNTADSGLDINFDDFSFGDGGTLDGGLHHVAFVYDHANSKGYAFVDGTLQSTTSGTRSRKAYQFTIGANPYALDSKLDGAVDEFRIFDGLALWTEDFRPPDALHYNLLLDAMEETTVSGGNVYPEITADPRVQLTDFQIDMIIRTQDTNGKNHRRTISDWTQSMTEYELIQWCKDLNAMSDRTFKSCTYRVNRTIQDLDTV